MFESNPLKSRILVRRLAVDHEIIIIIITVIIISSSSSSSSIVVITVIISITVIIITVIIIIVTVGNATSGELSFTIVPLLVLLRGWRNTVKHVLSCPYKVTEYGIWYWYLYYRVPKR